MEIVCGVILSSQKPPELPPGNSCFQLFHVSEVPGTGSAIVSCCLFWGPWQMRAVPCLNAHLVLAQQFNTANTKSKWIIIIIKLPTSNTDRDFVTNMVLTTCAKPARQTFALWGTLEATTLTQLDHSSSHIHSAGNNSTQSRTTVNKTVQQSTT